MKYSMRKILLTTMFCSITVLIAACSTNESTNNSEVENMIEITETTETQVTEAQVNEAKAVDKLVWQFQTGDIVNSSPIVSDNMIYFGSSDGNLYALNKATGEEVWKYSIGFPISCMPLVQNNKIYFSGADIFAAVDAKSGEEIWLNNKQVFPDKKHLKDAWDYHEAAPVIDGDVVYMGSFSGIIYGFDVNTGATIWEFDESKGSAVRSTLLIADGVMYYGDWHGVYTAVDIAKKEILWQNKYFSPFQNAAVLQDGVLIVGGRDTYMRALDCKSGDVLWEVKDPDGSWITGDPVINGDLVYFSTSDAHKIYAIKIADGTVAAEYHIYKNSFSKVIIENSKLYVTSGDAYSLPSTGKVEVFDLNDPSKTVEEYSIEAGGIFTSPVIDDKILYFGCTDNSVYAVKLDSLK